MKTSLYSVAVIAILSLALAGCKEKKIKIKYEYGFFPDTVLNLEGINTVYDDYNASVEMDDYYSLQSTLPIVFSSNRKSSGAKFDLVYGEITYTFDKVTGEFTLGSEIQSEDFFETLTSIFNTSGDDFGPNRIFCSEDGMEYMFVASETSANGLDIRYSKYAPYISSVPQIPEPTTATLFNSAYNDAYVSFDATFDTAYFCSDRTGDFNIYYVVRPSLTSFSSWLLSSSSPVVVDSLYSTANEKCPFVSNRVMLFASDMDGGYGGYDLYYSVFSNGKWSAPRNMGEEINSSSNEYRPVIGTDINFTNRFIIFSSDRPGGKGNYDLYLGPLDIDR